MSDILKPGLSLFFITLVAALVLGFANSATKDLIAQNRQITKEKSMIAMFPQAESFGEAVKTGENTGVLEYSQVFIKGEETGYVFVVSSSGGYSGRIEMLVGIGMDGVVSGIDIVHHAETPGLGANADSNDFKSQYVGKSGELRVVKSNNPSPDEVQAISAATITSHAVTQGVNMATDFFNSQLGGGRQ